MNTKSERSPYTKEYVSQDVRPNGRIASETTVMISSVLNIAFLLLLGALIAWQFPKPSWADFLIRWLRFVWKLLADFFKKGPPPENKESSK